MKKLNFSSNKKLGQVICAVLLLCFTFLGFGTAEIYLSNKNEFWFNYSEMMPVLVLYGIGIILIATVVLMTVPRKIYDYLITFIYMFSILMYLQGNFFPNNYGILNGESIDWSQYLGRAIINTIIWIVCLLLGQIIVYKFKGRYIWVFQTVAIVIVLTQLVTLGAVIYTSGEKKKADVVETKDYLSTKGEFEVSSGHNTIVFVLDCFDAQLFVDLIEKYPDLKNDFVDFTFYRNTVGGATRTKYAIPFILTGETNKEGVSYSTYVDSKSEVSSLYRELRNGDYDARLFTHNGYNSLKQTDAIDNIETGQVNASSRIGLTGTFLKLTAFRYAPHIIKRFFWLYSREFNQWQDSTSGTDPYIMDDVAFFEKLENTGLSMGTDKNVLRFYHLEGAHGPYTMDENCNRVSDVTTEEQQALGSLKIVKEYVDNLNRLGLYDKSDIFVMSDHGYNKYSKYEQNPLFMVKECRRQKKFEEVDIPLSYISIPSEFVASLRNELETDNYEQEGKRYFYVGVESNNTTYIEEYVTDGLAYDPDATVPTGVSYSMDVGNIEYKLGDKLYFGEKNECTAKPYIVEGINYIESDYAWTDGHTVRLQFDIGGTGDNLRIMINTVASIDEHQRIKFMVGSNDVAFHISSAGEMISFIVPKEYVQEDGILDLRILLPDAYSPAEAGTGVDGRVLGIAISDMTIEKTEEEFDYESQFRGYEGNEFEIE